MSLNKEQLADIARRLGACKKVLVSTHISPDSDAIGSSFALALALRLLGIEVVVYLFDVFPERMEPFRAGVSPIHSIPEKEFDAFVGLDAATANRLGDDFELLLKRASLTFNLDHHVSNSNWAEINYVDCEAAASAQIVFSLIKELGVSVDTEMANLLYAGLADDTGSFRYSNVNEKVFMCAAEIVRCGAQPERVSNWLYYSVPARVMQLRALAMEVTNIILDGQVGMVIVTKEMLDRCGATAQDSEGIIDDVRALRGTIGAVFMRETDDGWKLSLRSKASCLNVQDIAAVFGGGGHYAAAGCRMRGSREDVERKIVAELEKHLCRFQKVT